MLLEHAGPSCSCALYLGEAVTDCAARPFRGGGCPVCARRHAATRMVGGTVDAAATSKRYRAVRKRLLAERAAARTTSTRVPLIQPRTAPPKRTEERRSGATSVSAAAFQDRIRARLQCLNASKFRWLNEVLYTSPSERSLQVFQDHPEHFDIYHRGFADQVDKWPTNPVDTVIAALRQQPPDRAIGDFGCGTAKLAQAFPDRTVHSFDLVAVNRFVTAADIANVPLDDGSLDIAVFCLSLMGTNWWQFIREANRVLKTNGALKIIEVKSRIPDARAFIDAVASAGFHFQRSDDRNKMFVGFDFLKTAPAPDQAAPSGLQSVLKPCLYKKR